jgi:hypothetical protein
MALPVVKYLPLAIYLTRARVQSLMALQCIEAVAAAVAVDLVNQPPLRASPRIPGSRFLEFLKEYETEKAFTV